MAEYRCAGRCGWRCGRCAVARQRLFAGGQRSSSINVGIVGAGIAGLACADALADSGVRPRSMKLALASAGAVCRCAISFLDKSPSAAANSSTLPTRPCCATRAGSISRLEDVSKEPGDVFYHFGGQHVPESTVVEEFREFVQVMRLDLRRLSNETTALTHTDADVALDRTSLLGVSRRRKRRQPRRRVDRESGDQRGVHRRVRSRARSAELPEFPPASSTPTGARNSRRSACPATSGTTCSMATIASFRDWRRRCRGPSSSA